VTVNEQDATGALTQATNYTYNYLDKLTGVNQGGQLRSYKYDAMGRLLYERIPEQSATINDGTGTMWSCRYTYTEFSAVATKQDARGVVKTYTHDALHQVSSVSYDTSNASGVAATAPVSLAYTTWGAISSVLVNYTPIESYSFDSKNRVSSLTRTIDSKTYTTSYEYNGANELTKFTYPSGSQVNQSYDSRGRLNSLADQWLAPYSSGMTYNVEARPTGQTLGNGVVETYTFDPNRSQLVSQTASKNSTSLMNLSYSYSASPGQSGANTTAGNTHQMISLSGTINGTTESATYTYDLQKRLVTSSQTSNGSSAQRRFSYDRWGNRTGMWDAVSSGNQLQNIVIDGANHIWSVNSSTSDPNYYYDAGGNLVWAGGHTYTYDAENRLVSVDGGATAQYSYDSQNQRVKKASGGATTHYVWDSGKIIAEHDGAAAGSWTTKVEYIYARSGLIDTRSYTVGQQQSTATTFYLSDPWSTRLVLDSSGNVIGRQAHLPFGEEFAEIGTQEKHHFTSYEAESASGTDYGVNRQYSQSVGRFMSADPYQANSYLVKPQSWNRYSYAENDPIHNVDPLGLFARPPDVGMPDPCNDGSPPPEPLGPATSCTFELRTDRNSVPLGRGVYSRQERLPLGFDPYVDNIGPGFKGGSWYYFFEVIFSNSASSIDDHLGWSITYQGGFSGSYRYQRPDGTLSDPVQVGFAVHSDPPLFGNAGFLPDLRYIWLDTPGYGTKHTTGADIVDATIEFSFDFEGKFEGNTICRKRVTFTLRVREKVARPWGIFEF
jgi:RHS repeat-associated protein